MAHLTSTAPYVWEAFVKKAEEASNALAHPVPIFQFQVGQYQPSAGYVEFAEIADHRWEWENLGVYTQNEFYEIIGTVTVATERTPNNEPKVVHEIMQETYTLFNAVIVTPGITERNAPVLGNEYPVEAAVWRTLPTRAHYSSGIGEIAGEPGGFYGQINWGWEFAAYITPH